MKKSSRKTTFLSALAIAVPAMGMAQDKVEASVGADFVSGYIWRGQDLGGCQYPTHVVSFLQRVLIVCMGNSRYRKRRYKRD